MSEEPREDELITDYLQPNQSETWRCLTCGKSSSDRDAIKRCHPLVDPSIAEVDDEAPEVIESHFLYPVSIIPSLVEYSKDLMDALQENTGRHPLKIASRKIQEHIDLQEDLEATEAFTLFTHLVNLQNLGLLPGYPRYTNTISDDDYTQPIPLQEFCSTHENYDGVVTNEKITESKFVTINRVYRSKVLSVTESFWLRTSLGGTTSPWKWVPYSSTKFPDDGYDLTYEDTSFAAIITKFDHSEFKTTAIFDDSTAHNVVVNELRNWLLTHSAIDWVSAPYVKRAPAGFIVQDGLAIQDSDKDPVWMYDVAGFNSQAQLQVLGNVIESEEFEEVFDQIKQIQEQNVAGYIVMHNRETVENFLSYGSSADWFSSETTPIDHFSRQPSLKAVNQLIDKEIPALSNVDFLTRKGLIDQVYVDRHSSFTVTS